MPGTYYIMATLDVWRKQLKLYAEVSSAPKMASRGIPPSFPASGGATGNSSQAIDDLNEDSDYSDLKVVVKSCHS